MEWMFLPLKRYAEFSGRSRRKEYWMFVLLSVIVFILFGAAFYFMTSTDDGPSGALIALFVIFALATVIPSLAVQVRRFHDQDKSGWWALLNLVPYVGGLIIFVFMLFDGTSGPNRFGADPKGRTA